MKEAQTLPTNVEEPVDREINFGKLPTKIKVNSSYNRQLFEGVPKPKTDEVLAITSADIILKNKPIFNFKKPEKS